MYLKTLEIVGFKSFPDKTKLTFTEGLTTIVGPNGSGKSNIADAISWVMGEQSVKNLRGGKMEDVIFGGTQKRRPTGFAQVSITFENSDHFFDMDATEVTIKRKYYRSGESDYFINNTAVRLKDVHELLMDTGLGRDGYSMISQGRIAEIVSVKSSERREIFEEAAGISKYRYRREQAERQLEKAQENILRLKDILGELEGRLAPLKEQSDKAEAFLDLSEKKKAIEISVQIEKLSRSQEALREYENRIMVVSTEYDAIEEELKAIELKMEEVFQAVSTCSVKMETVQKDKHTTEESIASIKSQTAVLENDIFHHSESIHRLEKEEQLLLGGEETLQKQMEECASQLEAFQKEKEQIEERLQAFIQQNEALLKKNLEHSHQTEELMEEKIRIEKSMVQAELDEKMAASTYEEIKLLYERLLEGNMESTQENEKITSTIEQMTLFLDELSLKKSKRYEVLAIEREKQEASQKTVVHMKNNVAETELSQKEIAHRIRLLTEMEERQEEAPRSVKTVMKLQKEGKISGVVGTVVSQIEAPSNFAVAIETAVGGGLQNLIVEKERDAKAAISVLKRENAGRATFFPLDTVKGRKIDERSLKKTDGFIGILSDKIQFDEKNRPVIEFLMGRIVLCDTLDNATVLARENRYQFRVVTLDGQLVNAGGSLTGGSKTHQKGVLSRRVEIENLRKELEKEKCLLIENTKKLEEEEKELQEQNNQILQIEAGLRQLSEDELKAQYEKETLEKRRFEQNERQKDAENEKQRLGERLEQLSLTTQKSHAFYLQKKERLTAIDELLQSLQSGENDLRSSKEQLATQMNEQRIREIEVEKDIEGQLRVIDSLSSRKAEQSGQATLLKNQLLEEKGTIEKIQEQISFIQVEKKENVEKIVFLEKEYQILVEKRATLEAGTTGNRQKEKELMGNRENLSREMARLEEQKRNGQEAYDKIVAALWDQYEMTVSAARKLAQPIDDLQKSDNELLFLRGQIRNLGTVNLSAIEEYREVNERFHFMSEQCADVEKSRGELLELIRELTRTMENQFGLTFEEIDLHFGRIFKELFGGGAASLELLDPENVLESGIDIHVEPPGKIVKNLSALSGGEQSLVAISIYFAILKVRPAPFCLLDEIEAALDDVNVRRFAAYLCRMAEKTQFIAISHRRGTMEAANVLYGVTMQEEGVSKILQLELGEIEERIGLKSE